MADMKIIIGFLILTFIFFACNQTKTKDSEKIYAVKISYDYHNYLENEKDKNKPLNINARNILLVNCDSLGQCFFDGVQVSNDSIKAEVLKLLKSDNNTPDMPFLKEKNYKHMGKVQVPTKFTIFIEFNRNIDYLTYFKIREEIIKAYSNVRNELALTKFGKSIDQLIESKIESDSEKLNEIYDAYPIRYTEGLK